MKVRTVVIELAVVYPEDIDGLDAVELVARDIVEGIPPVAEVNIVHDLRDEDFDEWQVRSLASLDGTEVLV